MKNSKPKSLTIGYTAEIDSIGEALWHRHLENFDGANIYQTWSYDEVRCGRKNIGHLLLKKDGVVVAMAQSRVVRLPLVGSGIAYVRWGPIWRQDGPESNEIFRQAVRALRNEYVCRRRLVLRIYPAIFQNTPSIFSSILTEEGFSPGQETPDRTLLLDLRPPLADLRNGLRQHWRRYLKVAEKNGLEIVAGTDDELFRRFVAIYREMVGRKKFLEPNNIEEFRSIQQHLPEKFKMKILLCQSGGKDCAGLVCSAMGNTAVYLFGATSNSGLKARGAYLLHWSLITWLKEEGFAIYDLHGINPVTNPGTFKFKNDLCGVHGNDKYFLGRFNSHSSLVSYSCVALGESLRAIGRRVRAGHRPAVTFDTSSASSSSLVPQNE